MSILARNGLVQFDTGARFGEWTLPLQGLKCCAYWAINAVAHPILVTLKITLTVNIVQYNTWAPIDLTTPAPFT